MPRAVLALASFVCIAAAVHAQSYVLEDLGTLGGAQSSAYGLNAAGVTGGSAFTAAGEFTSALWPPSGAAQNIGILPGYSASCVRTVGDAGEAVGFAQDDLNNPPAVEAYVWLDQPRYGLPAGLTGLGTLGGNTSFVGQSAINADGAIVGWSAPSPGAQSHAFLWLPAPNFGLPAGMTDLGVLGGPFSTARAINGKTQVVGETTVGGGNQQVAFLWTPGGGMQSLGNLGGQFGGALDINEQEIICGYSFLPGNQVVHAWVKEPGGPLMDIGTLPQFPNLTDSLAYSVNSAGQVVGWVAPSPCCQIANVARAFLWDPEEGMRDLNDIAGPLPAGWVLESAWNINDAGQIVGNARVNGEVRAYRLTPVNLTLDATPAAPITPTNLTLRVSGGVPGNLVFLGLLRVNGQPIPPVLCAADTLDADGAYELPAFLDTNLIGVTCRVVSATYDAPAQGFLVSNALDLVIQ
jgi:probable HAF family extracellular repeat protein